MRVAAPILPVSIACVALAGSAVASDVTQLSFTNFYPSRGTCELVRPGFLSDPTGPRWQGKISTEKRGPICMVALPTAEFDRHFRYCALAFVETSPSSDYVCGVVHYGGVVEFSYGFKYGSVEPPMCSFVCQGR
jgi:hypothetical protein